MDARAELETTAPVDAVFAQLQRLDNYPKWLDIVSRAQPTAGDPGDPGDAWMIDLRAQLGPLRRSKRLRIVRSELDPPNRVRFVRRELEDRNNSLWSLTVEVRPTESEGENGSIVNVHMHYGGALWIPMLDRILEDEIRNSKPRLAALVESNGDT